MSFSKKAAANAAAIAWTNVSSCAITFTRLGDSSGTISFTDSRSDAACADFSQMPGFPSTANGATATPSSNYTHFDSLLNSLKTWYNGSPGYLDENGIFTHEFGHAAGLADVIYLYPAPVPTMFYSNTDLYPPYADISYYLSTLEQDDINGIRYVDSQI